MLRFPSLKVEGGLLGGDLIEQIFAGSAEGQSPKDFGFNSEAAFSDYLAFLWNRTRELWEDFQARLEKLPPEDPATTLTRERLVVPLLELLGYQPTYQREAVEVDGRRYHLSHRADPSEEAPFVHIVGIRQILDKLSPSGPRMSPHAYVQDFLNRTEHLWAIVTNGAVFRLLRDSQYLVRQAYIEFNLQEMLANELFADFQLFVRLVHRTRLPKTSAEAEECLLERYRRQTEEQGSRIRDKLRDGVEKALKILGKALLRHLHNKGLRQKIREGHLKATDFYEQLLRLIYRVLFLLVAEERNLLAGSRVYRDHYSISRLRRLTEVKSAWSDHHDDLWLGLQKTFQIFADEQKARLLGVAPLNGDLFRLSKTDAINDARVSNEDLLRALWHLCWFRPDEHSPWQRVNYAALDVEELGSIYESLLDFHPTFREEGGQLVFELAPAGMERKSTGSYYTPRELVGELVKSALEPVLLQKEPSEHAILSLKILDPACGSGHFLLAAARRLATELARIRTGEEQPNPQAYRLALRDVVRNCLYGVDKNPLAVELCKVALWIESHAEGKPLAFLDHHIKCGDSLVGVLSLDALTEGIPDEAYEADTKEEKKIASRLKRRNRNERANRHQFVLPFERATEPIRQVLTELTTSPDDEPEQVREKERRYSQLQQDPHWWQLQTLCHLWTAPFFAQFSSANADKIPTSGTLFNYQRSQGAVRGDVIGYAWELAHDHRFFHWPLEFPEVFAQGGFDVVLGNPPWERIKLQEQEFFAVRDPEIAGAPNAAARKRAIQQLPQTNPKLWHEYQEALHAAESTSRFLRHSGFFPLTGRGDINTYSVFAERMRALLKPGGRAGIIVPTGIATDDTNKHFFADLVESGGLVSLYDFENRQGIFAHVHRSYKFSLLTMGRSVGSEREETSATTRSAQLAFFCTRSEHLRDPRRVFALSSEDIARINPNTRTLPVFRTRQDAELTKAIYARVPVLVNERTGENPWGVRFMAMFHMSNDSHLFRTREELEGQGFRLVGNRFVKGREVWLPLYEAKMIWHYDHRYGTYAGVDSRSSTHLPTPDEAQHAEGAFLVQPWYWVPAEEVEARLGEWKRGWLLGFRDVTNATNERTAIFSLLPRVGVSGKLPLLVARGSNSVLTGCFVSNWNSIALDYVARQKIGGVSMSWFLTKQVAVLPPSAYTPEDLLFIVPRVLELVYTAWDLKPFADDVWREADEGLRAAIRQQWEENKAHTGGHAWDLPDWIWAYPEIETDPQKGIPLPPFQWNGARRALIRAELDAYYARLYSLTRKQLRYILDPADLTDKELDDILDPSEEVKDPLDPEGYAARVAKSDFPGETFRVLKEKEMREHGEYRTRRLVLEAWESMKAGRE